MELAQRNKSHLRIVHPQSLPQLYLGMHGPESMRGGDFPAKDRNGAWAQFVPLPCTTGGALVREISLSDLIIIGQESGWLTVSEQTTLGTALFATYRPICLVRPAKPADGLLPIESGPRAPQWKGETALIAWRDSAESMRATLGALPLLQEAKKVFIVTAHDHGTSVSSQTYLLVLDYLASHDVKAEVIDLDRGDQSAASIVLAKAHDVGADFVTMGAYGHSVFREMLLGGFSATMLEDCQLPLILSH